MATDDDIQLSDMLESYPPAITPGFQTLITAKKEFSELASTPEERLPEGRGQYLKHQKFDHRILRAYPDLVIFDEPGSGKSCSVLGFVEYAHRELLKAKLDPTTADEKSSHYKRVVILAKGPNQIAEIRNQIICRCSDGHYEADIAKRSKSDNGQKTNRILDPKTAEKVQRTNITLELKRSGISVETYTSYAHRIEREFPTENDDERLAEHASDTIFWFDEAHNILVDIAKPKTYREKQQTYNTLWRVFHLARRCKRIISTATPMINDVKEIGSLMNLILPLDGIIPQGYDYRTAPANDIRVFFPNLPLDHRTATPEEMAPYFRGQFPPDYDFMAAGLEDLEPFFRGKITFIRAADTGAKAVEQGARQHGEYEARGVRYQTQLVLYATTMSEHQDGGYQLARQANGGRDDLFAPERQASNFVFPDGYWGNDVTEEEKAIRREARRAKKVTGALAGTAGIPGRGTRRGRPIAKDITPVQVEELPIGGILPIAARIEPREEEGAADRRAFARYVAVRGDNYAATTEFLPWLQDLAYIGRLSSKFSEIVRIVMGEPGNAFIYGEFVDGSGLIVLALCFEGMGFTRYNETESMFEGVVARTVKPICAGSEIDATHRRVKPGILSRQQGAPFRYALLAGKIKGTRVASIMEAMNSYENRHGDYIKVLLSSRVGRDAINVNNVLQIHLVAADWNQSAMYQARSRGLRATSHQDLIKEEQDRIRLEGGDPATARIDVNVYNHAAVSIQDPDDSIDLKMYRVSEYKDRIIKRMMRICKQCAIGCQIHYNRNVRPNDVDGSSTCDYDICRYPCVDPPPTEEDYTTYDVLYADEIILNVVNDIINVFRQRNVLTINEIEALLPNYRAKYLIMSLERLITSKTPLTDRFGYTTYLREDKGSFYLDRSYPTGIPASRAMSYYTQGLIGIERESLSAIVVKHEAGENRELMTELEQMDVNDPNFNIRLGMISIEGQAAILEEVILRVLGGDRNEFTDAVIAKYQRMIFYMNEPVTDLNREYDLLAQRKPRQGRKKNPETKRRTKKINPNTIDETKIPRNEDTEMVYLHILYSQVVNQTAYATTAKFNKGEGRTRILKPSEIQNGWRDLNEVELPIYNAFIQIENAARARPFEEQGLYGFILPDGKFRIRDKLTEDPGAADDARKIKRGLVCKDWHKPKLIDVLFEVGADPPGGLFPDFKPGDEPQIIHFLLQRKVNSTYEELITWPLDKLIWYYKWHSATKVNRVVICDIIKHIMAETGRLVQ